MIHIITALLITVIGQTFEMQVEYTQQEFDPKKHDRFYEGPDKAFIGQAYDFSGVFKINNDTKWATFITPNFFVSAAHYHPGTGNILRGYLNNDTNIFFETKVVWTRNMAFDGVSSIMVDHCIGMVDKPLPPEYKIYPIHRHPTISDNWSSTNFIYVGRRPAWNGKPRYGFAIGTRRTPDGVAGDYLEYTLLFTSSTSPQLVETNNVHGVGGDSGGPTFEIINGQLVLVGTHWRPSSDAYYSFIAEDLNRYIRNAPSNNHQRVHSLVGKPRNVIIIE